MFSTNSGFPLGLENLENLEKWEGIFQSGKIVNAKRTVISKEMHV